MDGNKIDTTRNVNKCSLQFLKKNIKFSKLDESFHYAILGQIMTAWDARNPDPQWVISFFLSTFSDRPGQELLQIRLKGLRGISRDQTSGSSRLRHARDPLSRGGGVQL